MTVYTVDYSPELLFGFPVAICPFCGAENIQNPYTGEYRDTCKHFMKATRRYVYFGEK